MTIQKLIQKYQNEVLALDESIAKIKDLIRKGREGDNILLTWVALKEKKLIANSNRQSYIQFIKDLESVKDLKTNL